MHLSARFGEGDLLLSLAKALAVGIGMFVQALVARDAVFVFGTVTIFG